MNPTSGLSALAFPRGGVWACVLGFSVGCGVERAASPVSPADRAGSALPEALMLVEADCPAPFIRYADADGDGVGDPDVAVEVCEEVPGFVADSGDCDDLRTDISPLAEEACGDGLDNNCDGLDHVCPAPDITTDAVGLLREAKGDGFGFTAIGGLENDTETSLMGVFGAYEAGSREGLTDDAGALLQVSALETLDGGDRVDFELVQTGSITGLPNTALGQSLARAQTNRNGHWERLYVGVGGSFEVPTGTASCGIVWWDFGLPEAGQLIEDSDGWIPCDLTADPTATTNGIEAVAVGFWPGEGDVVAAPRTANDIIWVLPDPESWLGDPMPTVGKRLNDLDEESLGEQVAWADLDGDGFDDLIAAAPTRGTVAHDAGGFDVFSGDELDSWDPGAEFDARAFGFGVAFSEANQNVGVTIATGDLTGDGRAEVILGSFEEDASIPASVYIADIGSFEDFGGRRLAVADLPASAGVTRITSDQLADLYGYKVAYIPEGDTSSAGLAIAAPGWDSAGDTAILDGRIYLFAASPDWLDSAAHDAPTAATTTIDTDLPGEALGTALADAGDVDGDGANDLWMTSFGISTTYARAVLLQNTGL